MSSNSSRQGLVKPRLNFISALFLPISPLPMSLVAYFVK